MVNEREAFYGKAIYLTVFGVMALVFGITGALAYVSPELFFPVGG